MQDMQAGIQSGRQLHRFGRRGIAGFFAADFTVERDIQILPVQAGIMGYVPFDHLLLFGMDSNQHTGFTEDTFEAFLLVDQHIAG